MNNIMSVIQLNTYIKRKFEQDYVLKRVTIEGELSNFKKHSSGHIYFTLKDNQAQVSCVLFRTYCTGEEKQLKDGDKVIVKGSVSLYEKTGQYQIYVKSIEKAGIGELYILYEQLKQALLNEGLFREEIKKPIPKYAKKIGIVTSSTGAAIQDIVQVAKRRNPYVELVLYPSLVQGSSAKEQIVKGIDYFNTKESVDLIIVGRGGGSIEDLWPFNEEMVARAVFHSTTPIISGVGHETDFTIVDFVADLRAPTPSAAAELAVFDYENFLSECKYYRRLLGQRMNEVLDQKRHSIQSYQQQLIQQNPRKNLEDKMMYLEQLRLLLMSRGNTQVREKRNVLSLLEERLKGKSPLARLEEGYGYVSLSGQRITKAKQLKNGDAVEVFFTDGSVETQVKKVKPIIS